MYKYSGDLNYSTFKDITWIKYFTLYEQNTRCLTPSRCVLRFPPKTLETKGSQIQKLYEVKDVIVPLNTVLLWTWSPVLTLINIKRNLMKYNKRGGV